jgi:IclR helix-turn-helix domain
MALIKSKCVPKYKLNNVVEAFTIISNMLDANGNLGLTQLSDDTLISKNKTFRLLSTLEQCGIVEKNEKSTYKIGMATIGIARKIMAKTSLLDSVRPYMEGLANDVNEAVYFACYIAGEAMLVDYADCCHSVKATSFVGKVLLLPDVSNLDIHGVSLSKTGDITVDVGGLDPDITMVSMPFLDDKGSGNTVHKMLADNTSIVSHSTLAFY